MQVMDLRNQIMQNNICNFYVFCGDELAVQDVYIQEIAKRLDAEIVRKETVSEAIQDCNNKSLFGNTIKKCFVVRDDLDFIKNESAWKNIDEKFSNACLILLCSNLDKRSKFYKTFQNVAAWFDYLQTKVLTNKISLLYDLSPDRAKALCQICKNSYGAILSELDKLHLLSCSENTSDFDILFDILYHDYNVKMLSKFDKLDVFMFVDCLLQKNAEKVLFLRSEIIQDQSICIAVLSIIANQLKQIMQVYDRNVSTDSCGLSAWQINHAKRYIGLFEFETLKTVYAFLQRTDEQIKQGLIDSFVAVDLLIIRFLQKR